MGWQDAPLVGGGGGGWQDAPLVEQSQPQLTPQALLASAQKKPDAPLSWSDVPGQMWNNAPSSAAHFASDIVQPFVHPIDTLTNIGDAGNGLAQKLGLASGTEDIPKADAVGEFFANRYGSMEGFKQALAKDPVGVAGDLSSVLSLGGAAARGAGLAGKVTNIVGKAAQVTDPLTYAAKLPAMAATKIAEHSLGLTTGVGGRAIETARLAGKEGGAASEAVRDQMRGNAPITEVVDDAHAALEQMRQTKQSAYRADQRALARDQTILSWNDVDLALNDMNKVANFKGQSTSKSTQVVRDKITAEIDNWKNLKAGDYWTPEGFDALKKSIGDIRETIPFEQKAARLVAKQAYDAIKGTIVKQAPAYAKTMTAYENASTAMREIEKSLALSPTASVDTALRKLTSTLRNNVNTNFGRREALVKQLQDAGAPQLTNKIAGQSLSSWEPRGLARLGPALGIPAAVGGAAATGGLGPLLAIPALAGASPRIVGEGARGLGALQRYGARAAPFVGPTTSRQIGRLGDPPNRIYVSPNRPAP